MSNDKPTKVSRRTLLKASLVLPLTAVIPALVIGKDANASSKASKATMMYQDKPHGKDECSNCVHFIPGKDTRSMGTCTVVAGAINPHAWCVAYTRKAGG